jgi:hypothetical protein
MKVFDSVPPSHGYVPNVIQRLPNAPSTLAAGARNIGATIQENGKWKTAAALFETGARAAVPVFVAKQLATVAASLYANMGVGPTPKSAALTIHLAPILLGTTVAARGSYVMAKGLAQYNGIDNKPSFEGYMQTGASTGAVIGDELGGKVGHTIGKYVGATGAAVTNTLVNSPSLLTSGVGKTIGGAGSLSRMAGLETIAQSIDKAAGAVSRGADKIYVKPSTVVGATAATVSVFAAFLPTEYHIGGENNLLISENALKFASAQVNSAVTSLVREIVSDAMRGTRIVPTFDGSKEGWDKFAMKSYSLNKGTTLESAVTATIPYLVENAAINGGLTVATKKWMAESIHKAVHETVTKLLGPGAEKIPLHTLANVILSLFPTTTETIDNITGALSVMAVNEHVKIVEGKGYRGAHKDTGAISWENVSKNTVGRIVGGLLLGNVINVVGKTVGWNPDVIITAAAVSMSPTEMRGLMIRLSKEGQDGVQAGDYAELPADKFEVRMENPIVSLRKSTLTSNLQRDFGRAFEAAVNEFKTAFKQNNEMSDAEIQEHLDKIQEIMGRVTAVLVQENNTIDSQRDAIQTHRANIDVRKNIILVSVDGEKDTTFGSATGSGLAYQTTQKVNRFNDLISQHADLNEAKQNLLKEMLMPSRSEQILSRLGLGSANRPLDMEEGGKEQELQKAEIDGKIVKIETELKTLEPEIDTYKAHLNAALSTIQGEVANLKSVQGARVTLPKPLLELSDARTNLDSSLQTLKGQVDNMTPLLAGIETRHAAIDAHLNKTMATPPTLRSPNEIAGLHGPDLGNITSDQLHQLSGAIDLERQKFDQEKTDALNNVAHNATIDAHWAFKNTQAAEVDTIAHDMAAIVAGIPEQKALPNSLRTT